jgi:ubiquinone biosynthesis protein COQ4
MHKVDRAFGEKFLTSIDDFYGYGVHLLFNEWWATAPQDAIDKYAEAITAHPEHGRLAAAGWMSPTFRLSQVADCAPGTLGAAWHAHMVVDGLAEKLADGYAQLIADVEASGKLARLPKVMKYKVLRGYQTHDLHHILTGYTIHPFHELALQAFQLAQMNYPYSAMTLTTVLGHATLVDPWLMQPAMDAITDGWAFGRRAKSIQFIDFENQVHRPLDEVRAEYGLLRDAPFVPEMPRVSDLVAMELDIQTERRAAAQAA